MLSVLDRAKLAISSALESRRENSEAQSMLPFTLESDQVRDGFPCNGNPVAGVPAQVSRGWEVACDLHSAPAQKTNSIAPEPNQNSSQNLPRPQVQQCRLGFCG